MKEKCFTLSATVENGGVRRWRCARILCRVHWKHSTTSTGKWTCKVCITFPLVNCYVRSLSTWRKLNLSKQKSECDMNFSHKISDKLFHVATSAQICMHAVNEQSLIKQELLKFCHHKNWLFELIINFCWYLTSGFCPFMP